MRRSWIILTVLTFSFIACTQQRAPVAADEKVATVERSTLDKLPNIGTRKKGVDWKVFLGPTGDSKSPEKGLVLPWPKTGPKIVWETKLGISYGIGSVASGRLYQFDRFDKRRGDPGVARLRCLNAETGKKIWHFEYKTDYADYYGYNGGPRCSPIVDGNRVYIYGVGGWLHCLRATDGKLVWKVDTKSKFGVVQNFFGVGSNPVIDGNLLIVMVGGSPKEDQTIGAAGLDRVTANGTAVVAFDKYTGKVKYKIAKDLASYASLKLATIKNRRWCFAFCRAGLIGFEPQSGKIDFQYPWRAPMLESVNASMPVVVKDEVFISECYRIGASLLKVQPGKHSVVWKDDRRKREKAMKTHWNTPIYINGYLYGCSGRNPPDADLRCIEWKTGKVMWKVHNQSRSSLLYVDGHLIFLGEYGKLAVIKPNPKKLEVVSECVIPEDPKATEVRSKLKAPCWAAPIISHGLLYVRGRDRLICMEVMKK